MKNFIQLIKRLEHNLKYYAGYPPNTNFDYSELYPFLKYPLNNIGDPFGSQSFFGSHEYEKAVIKWFLNLYAENGQGWGYVTSGSTEGILFGLWNGREKLNNPVVYYSDYAHYAIPKSVRLLNLEYKIIPTDKSGEMDYDAFEKILIKNRDALIVPTIGSTMTASVDNISKLIAVLKTHNISYYIHADAAIEGMMLPFINTSLAFKLSHGLDSVSISGHKIIGSPIPCGVVLTHKNYIASDNKIEYLGLHDATITGSRNGFTPLILWHAIKKYGKAGFAHLVNQSIEKSKYYCELFNKNNIAAWRFPHSISVVLNKWPDMLSKKWRVPSNAQYTTLTALPKLTVDMVNEIIADIQYFNKHQALPPNSEMLISPEETEEIELKE